jgi:Spy/CpxP family protein refolding chaperone
MARSLRWMSLVFAALAVVALCTAAQAQRGPGGRGPGRGGPGFGFGGGDASLSMMYGMLLNSPKVQKELDLIDDQTAKIKEANDKTRKAMSDLWSGMRDLSPEDRQAKMEEIGKKMQALGEEAKKTIETTLLPNQLARLKGIAIQVAGVRALSDKGVQKDLKFSDDQTAKIKSIGEDFGKKMREAFTPGGDWQEMRTKMDELRKENEKQLLDVLNADQKAALEKMKGAKLDIPANELWGGGRRGNRGGNKGGDKGGGDQPAPKID